jgi:2,4-dienoyl-CoA reductase-like NADH-dependent reductase (Old Yellow Enzyme family)
MSFLLEAAYVIAEEFSSERVGVRLSPCSREGQLEQFAEVMRAVSERELAYIHLADVKGPRTSLPGGHSVSISACAARRAFRSDISCVLIASDYCDVDVAASAVESRWADAVGFLQANDDPDFIVRLLRQERESRSGG